MEIFLYFAAFLKVVRLVPTQNSISAKYQPIVQPWCLENKHKDTHMALSITSCHQQQIKTFTVTQRQEKSAGQKNLGGSREPRCGRVQGERWHASWVWGKTDDSQIAKMDLRLPIWRISSSLTDLLCLSVCLSAPCCTSSYSLEMLSDWKKQKVLVFFSRRKMSRWDLWELKADFVCQLCLRFSNVNHCIIMQCFVCKRECFLFWFV